MRCLVLAALVVAVGCAGKPGVGTTEGNATESADISADAIFSLDRVHRIDISVAEGDVPILDQDFDDPEVAQAERQKVPCTVTIDGVTFEGADIKKKGFFGSSSNLNGKPAFNISFGDTRPAHLKKLTLNNALQDDSFLHEHLAYELYRQAGLHAPRTSHGDMTFNGRDYGLYVVAEPVDKTALKSWFGDGNGNLYEGSGHDILHGVDNPGFLELKDEQEDGRNRDDLVRLLGALGGKDVEGPIDVGAVDGVLNLDQYLTAYALDSVLAHFDGPFWNDNNFYLYANPADGGRFTLIPHGADRVFDVSRDLLEPPKGRINRRIRDTPDLDADLRNRIQHIIDDVWNEGALLARMEQVRQIVNATPEAFEGGAFANDVFKFNQTFDGMVDQINRRKAERPGL